MHRLDGRINTALLVMILLAICGLIATIASRAGAGPLDPPGPPSATGTLPQVEPRSPIPPVGWDGSFPITIAQSGSYFLTRNLAASSAGAIAIQSGDVTLDLSGFTISTASTGDGIFTGSTLRTNVVIRNGAIEGFYRDIAGEAFVRSRFEDLRLGGATTQYGLDIGSGNEVLRVVVWGAFNGMKMVQQTDNFGGSVIDSVFSRNRNWGVDVAANNVLIRGCVLDANNSTGIILDGSFNTIEESRVVGNTSYGVLIGGNRNVVARNNIDGNTAGQVVDSGAGNIVGPQEQGLGTHPNANIGFP